MPDHSVIIPTYNHGEFLTESINSVLENCKNIELIIINDGSTDNTSTILAGFTGVKNLRLINQTNKGAHAALNVGMSLAEGRYISILNDDDIYLENHLEYAFAVLEQNISNFVIHRAEVFGEGDRFEKMRGHVERGDFNIEKYGLLTSLFKFNWSVSTSSFSFSRVFYEKGLRFSNLKMNHDLDFLMSALFRFDARCFYSDLPTWKYRIHEMGSGNFVRSKRQKLELSYTLLRTLILEYGQIDHAMLYNLIDYDIEVENLHAIIGLLEDRSFLDNPDKFNHYLNSQYGV